MNRFEEACPFEAATRAARCTTCCAANQVPPCVAAYLQGKARGHDSNVIPLVERKSSTLRRAA